jgi:hypothetical protein
LVRVVEPHGGGAHAVGGGLRAVQRLLDPFAVRFKADHLAREPLEHLTAEGFAVDELQRSKLGIVERVEARKPA